MRWVIIGGLGFLKTWILGVKSSSQCYFIDVVLPFFAFQKLFLSISKLFASSRKFIDLAPRSQSRHMIEGPKWRYLTWYCKLAFLQENSFTLNPYLNLNKHEKGHDKKHLAKLKNVFALVRISVNTHAILICMVFTLPGWEWSMEWKRTGIHKLLDVVS